MNTSRRSHPVSKASETGLGKTFLIGVATPFVTIGCVFARKHHPSWMTKEFVSSTTRPLKNICFAFGLAAGTAAITGPAFLAVVYAMEEHPVSSAQSVHAPKAG